MKILKAIFYTFISLFLVYTLVGFFLIPYLAKQEIISKLDELLITKTKIDKIYLNPLTLNLDIYNFRLEDEKEQDIIAFKNLNIDFSLLKSIEKKHINIKNISLNGIYLNIIEEQKGVFNLANLIDDSIKKDIIENEVIQEENDIEKDVKTNQDIKYFISKITLKDANIDFTSFANKERYNLSLKDINYTIYDFGTYKNSLASNNLELILNEDTNIKIGGGLKLEPFDFYGKIDIQNLKIKDILDFDKSFFNFSINENANLNLILNYNLYLKDILELTLHTDLFEINDVKLEQDKKQVASLNKLDIKRVYFDLNSQNIELNNILFKDLNLNMILNKDGLNFANLVNLDSKEDKVEEENSKPWIVNLSNLNINSNFNFSDNINNANLKLKDLKLTTNSINIIDSKVLVKGTNIATSNSNYIDNKNSIDISSNRSNIRASELLLKDDFSFSSLEVNLDDTNFQDLKSKLSINSKNTNLKIDGFLLDKENNISIKQSDIYKTDINFFDANSSFKIDTQNTNLKLSDLSLKNGSLIVGKTLLKEPKIDILNLDSNLNIQAKNIDLNLGKIVNKENLLKIEKTTINNPHISIVLPKDSTTKKEKQEPNNTLSSSSENSKKRFRLNLGPMDIKNMTLDFEDKNLAIPFKTTISNLNGEVSQVKNRDKSTSDLIIQGVVDKYGVAKITGIVNPNSLKILTDINMKFQNISMNSFTPYTAKFVGREIKDGKLELDLNYNISNSNLKAKNNIIIKQLKLGNSIQSPEAISLPLDLAITLLEDSSNKIDINLPISGNIDDPQFSIGAIVWKAFVNLITKAITAPFSLLGSLFNFSEDEINSVNFSLNESDITPIQKETLDKLAIILKEKDEFAIEYSASFDENKEKEDIAIKRANNIKEYLVNEKSIPEKQIIINKNIKKSTQNINLSIENIK